MKYFLDTTETIADGVGFSQFGILHIVWMIIAAVTIIAVSRIYKSTDSVKRAKIRKIMAGLIIFDEIWKMFFLAVGGRYIYDYLPFHLCSVNIFLIAWHAVKPNKMLDNFLYAVCIPGAMAALLFPSWTKLPLFNFMHLHSFTIHTLLVLYPVMLTYAGDIKPKLKDVPKCLGLLFVMAQITYYINRALGTNFMFLMEADANNPLYVFEQMWGNHLLGLPVIMSAIVIVMYAQILLKNKIRK
ncbi:MAG: TIGR02206 family membrane protein [Clostridia bacterium]|nr:TIGR02206 family membrane protein [Clostridia bacterium]